MTIIYTIFALLAALCGANGLSAMALAPRVQGYKTSLVYKNHHDNSALISSSLIKGSHCNDFRISPLVGVALVESRFLQNLHLLGDPQSPITEVVRELFHNHNFQTYDFRATIVPHSPASTLDFKRTAAIQKTLTGSGKIDRDTFIADWKSGHAKEKKSTLSVAKFNKFLDLMAKAQKVAEEHGYPLSVSAILTALAMRKSFVSHDVEEYLAHHGIDKPVVAYDRFHAIDFGKKFFGRGRVGFLTEDLLAPSVFESSSVALMVNQNSANNLSPEVDGSIYCGFRGGNPCATCHEAALRDLVNNLVFDAEKNRYDCAVFGTAPLNPLLKTFYEEFDNPAEHNNQKVAQAWMNIVSGISTVSYERGRAEYSYEISGKASSSFAVLNYLLCSNKAKDWKDLGALLSDDNRRIVINYSRDMTQEYVSFLIDSQKADAPSLELKLVVHPQHIAVDIAQRHGNNGRGSRAVSYGMALYQALLNKAFNKNAWYDRLLGKTNSVSTEAFCVLPFVRHFISDAENTNVLMFEETNKEFFKTAPFGVQQYYLLARPLKTAYQKVSAIDDGCALLAPESKDLAAQLARMVDHMSDSFAGASRVLYGIIRVHGAAIVEHTVLAESLARAFIVCCEKATTEDQKKIVSDLLDRYKQSPLWNHPSADAIKNKI